MADLKYDTLTMRETAHKYREIAINLRDLQISLQKHIHDLKNTYWKSDAGAAFQSMYDDDCVKNLDKYVAVLDEMAGQLDKAARDYDSVTSKLQSFNVW